MIYHKTDDFQTPPWLCKKMVDMVPVGAKTVLEPTPGQGNIVEALISKNYQVTAPTDFFNLEIRQFDCVVMNPPFSAKYCKMENAPHEAKQNGMRVGYYILYRCMEMTENVIALMPWFTISDSDVRLRHIMDYGCRSITALPRKTFKYTRIQTTILQLQKGFAGRTEFKFISSNGHITGLK